ncbi:MAG: hypothetical protein QOE90_2777 [Thermoplasmata archaeon]|jgi:hypothetical protein|nr:hypothetical protein [Thermoplasmata archaeon]
MSSHRARLDAARVLAAIDGAKAGAREAPWREVAQAARDAAIVGAAYSVAFLEALGDVARHGLRRLRRPLGLPSRLARE